MPKGRATSQPTSTPVVTTAPKAIHSVAGASCVARASGNRDQRSSSQCVASGVSQTWASQPPKTGKASRGRASCVSRSRSRRKRAARAGLKVSELKVEMIVEAAIVTANWRKKCPVSPLMTVQGTKTALRTSPTAMTGPETWLMALIVASRGARPCSM